MKTQTLYASQVLNDTYNLVQVVPSPDAISVATATVAPDDGGCPIEVSGFTARQVELKITAVTEGRYQHELYVETTEGRAFRVCSEMIVQTMPEAAPLVLNRHSDTIEKYQLYYGLRLQTGEAVKEASAVLPAGITTEFSLHETNGHYLMMTLAIDNTVVAGAYDIPLATITTFDRTFDDTIRVFVDGCDG